MILGANGERLSKRHGAVSVTHIEMTVIYPKHNETIWLDLDGRMVMKKYSIKNN